ncbi:MAG: phosphoglycerate dehydrogenase [Elusimicrobia bacterium]|nr:phosphoglycerate dehydrogenase [Elusimicrobiota bacterium]
MFRILVSDPIDAEGLNPIRQNKNFELLETKNLNGSISDIEAWLVRSETKITKEKIEKAKKLKLIGRAGTGVDNIDVEEATRRGILVMNVPGANAIAVAEHVFALTLSLLRKIPAADKIVKEGGWRDKTLGGGELYGKTLGILGLGRVGKEVAQRARAFQMEILSYDPFVNSQRAGDLGIRMVSQEELLRKADILTIHVPLTSSTQNLISEKTIEIMKKGAVIINTSRGEVIDEKALAKALQDGKIAGAALDVFAKEPPQGSPLLNLKDQVILTPHLAGSTKETQKRVAKELAQSVVDYFERGLVRGGVNLPPEFEPEILDRLGRHLALTERLGRFLGQTLPGAWNKLMISTTTRFTEKDQKVLLHGALRGLLACALGDKVNVVNAAFYAKERNIQSEVKFLDESAQPIEEISLLIQENGKTASVSGRVEATGELRIVQIGKLFVDVDPEGTLIVIDNIDKPGMIGKVGTLLGAKKINIADMRVGRQKKGEAAIMVLTVDSEIPKATLEALKKVDGVTRVCQVSL